MCFNDVSFTYLDTGSFKCSSCGCLVTDAEGYAVYVEGSKNCGRFDQWSFCPKCGEKVDNNLSRLHVMKLLKSEYEKASDYKKARISLLSFCLFKKDVKDLL